MEFHIKEILGHNLFDHISYVVMSPKDFLLEMSKNLVTILVSLEHYIPMIMLTYVFLYSHLGWVRVVENLYVGLILLGPTRSQAFRLA